MDMESQNQFDFENAREGKGCLIWTLIFAGIIFVIIIVSIFTITSNSI